jgi:hypothetical protein
MAKVIFKQTLSEETYGGLHKKINAQMVTDWKGTESAWSPFFRFHFSCWSNVKIQSD